MHLVTPRPRVVLADDHVETGGLLRELLEPEFDVVAYVQDGHALVGAVELLRPDAIVSDISMPGIDGIAAAKVILRANPDARIIFVTVHGDAAYQERALSTGSLGYVLKLTAGDELVPAVRSALHGEPHVTRTSFPPEIRPR
jgi:DNA-binding NarL/FixJ family response regulator